jgi:hypothetical protein
MVILSLICSSPPAEQQATCSLYLQAAVVLESISKTKSQDAGNAANDPANAASDEAHAVDETEYTSGDKRAVPPDIVADVDEIIAGNRRFPRRWAVVDRQAMVRQEQVMENALTISSGEILDTFVQSMHNAFCSAVPELHGILQPLGAANGLVRCKTCKVSLDGPGVPLTSVQRDSRLTVAWVFIGRTIFQAPVRTFRCNLQTHTSTVRLARPRGVEWTSVTYLFDAIGCWFFAVALLVEVTNMVAQARAAPSTAIQYHLARSYAFMDTFAPEAPTPLQQTAITQMYRAWYAYIFLVDDENVRFAVCRLCGHFPKVGADACAKSLMSLSSESSRKQLLYPSTRPLCCDVCLQQLGSNGGWAIRFFDGPPDKCASKATHHVCFGCLDSETRQRLLDSKAIADAAALLQNSATSAAVVEASVANIQSEVNELCASMEGPQCPLCPLSMSTQTAATHSTPASYPKVTAGPRLWTQRQLYDHCGQHLLRLCFHGGNPDVMPIPVEKVPPIFQAPEIFASETLYNTSRLKGLNSGYSSVNVPGPTADAIEPLRELVASGELVPAALRENSYGNASDVQRWLVACKMAPAVAAKVSAALGRDWLMKALDLMTQGRDDCKFFVSAAHGTGGTADVSCLHGVEVVRKFLFEQESTRDHVDNFRCLKTWPQLAVIDASCGVVATMESNYPKEADALWGDYHGTFKPFIKEKAIIHEKKMPDLTPVEIPSFELSAARRLANDANLRQGVAANARRVLEARGAARLERHPLQTGRHWQRAVSSDKWHQSPYVLKRAIEKKNKPHTHRKISCTQHLMHVCSSLSDTRTSIMESLNGRRKRHLATVCTTDPIHHMIFVEKLRVWGNQEIIGRQDELLEKERRPGEMVIIDPDIGVGCLVCANCRQGGHTAQNCSNASQDGSSGAVKEVVDKPEGLEAGTVKNDSGTVEHKDEDTNQKTSSITIVLSASHVSNQERQTKPWL